MKYKYLCKNAKVNAKVRFTEHAFIQSEDTDPFTDADLTVAYILFPQTNFTT